MRPNKKPRPHKSDADLRHEGIILVQNAIKARSMAEPLIDKYLCNQAAVSDTNWACYLMQQSIELALKGLIKYYYKDFREGHFVRHNANILIDMFGEVKELREISDILDELKTKTSVMLFKWESISRYKDIRVTKDDIEKIDQLTENLVAFLHRHQYNEEQ